MKLIHPKWINFNILESSFEFLPYAHLLKSLPPTPRTPFPLRPPHATWKGAQTEDRSIALMPWEKCRSRILPSWHHGFWGKVRVGESHFYWEGSMWKAHQICRSCTVPVQPSQLRTLETTATGYCKLLPIGDVLEICSKPIYMYWWMLTISFWYLYCHHSTRTRQLSGYPGYRLKFSLPHQVIPRSDRTKIHGP